jgi:hypothetical protein
VPSVLRFPGSKVVTISGQAAATSKDAAVPAVTNDGEFGNSKNGLEPPGAQPNAAGDKSRVTPCNQDLACVEGPKEGDAASCGQFANSGAGQQLAADLNTQRDSVGVQPTTAGAESTAAAMARNAAALKNSQLHAARCTDSSDMGDSVWSEMHVVVGWWGGGN